MSEHDWSHQLPGVGWQHCKRCGLERCLQTSPSLDGKWRYWRFGEGWLKRPVACKPDGPIVSEHDRAWEIADRHTEHRLDCEWFESCCGCDCHRDERVERLAQAIREHGRECWLDGFGDGLGRDEVKQARRYWAARTIRRLRSELRDEKRQLRIPGWAKTLGISLKC